MAILVVEPPIPLRDDIFLDQNKTNITKQKKTKQDRKQQQQKYDTKDKTNIGLTYLRASDFILVPFTYLVSYSHVWVARKRGREEVRKENRRQRK